MKSTKKKKESFRTCVGCRETKFKKELIRIVRLKEGDILIDPSGKRSGRGAYLCPDKNCLEKAEKNKSISKALKISLEKEKLESVRNNFFNLIKN